MTCDDCDLAYGYCLPFQFLVIHHSNQRELKNICINTKIVSINNKILS